MVLNWYNLGIELVKLLVYTSVSLAFGALLFRKYMAPSINTALEEATKTAKTLASLGGMKKGQYTASKSIEKAVAADLIKEKLPELEALKLILSPGTWEQIEETIDEHPEAVIQLYEKYGYLMGSVEQTEKIKLDF